MMDYIDGELGHNKSEMAVSFFIKKENKIALSEMSFMDKSSALDFLEMTKEDSLYKIEDLIPILEESSGVLFYNRLNVPEKLRGNGYGKTLLQETIKFCKENNYLLINTANNYGDMGQEKLIKFYQTEGMLLIHHKGLLVYHKNLILYQEHKIITKKKIK